MRARASPMWQRILILALILVVALVPLGAWVLSAHLTLTPAMISAVAIVCGSFVVLGVVFVAGSVGSTPYTRLRGRGHLGFLTVLWSQVHLLRNEDPRHPHFWKAVAVLVIPNLVLVPVGLILATLTYMMRGSQLLFLTATMSGKTLSARLDIADGHLRRRLTISGIWGLYRTICETLTVARRSRSAYLRFAAMVLGFSPALVGLFVAALTLTMLLVILAGLTLLRLTLLLDDRLLSGIGSVIESIKTVKTRATTAEAFDEGTHLLAPTCSREVSVATTLPSSDAVRSPGKHGPSQINVDIGFTRTRVASSLRLAGA